MERVKLRQYKSGDFPDILELWKSLGLSDDARGDSSSIIKQTLECNGKFLILEDIESSKIIGTCWITNDGRRLYLHHLGINPSFQNRGYGKLLIMESIKFGKKLKLQMKLEVHKTNKEAIHIYKRLGFSLLGDYDVYIIRDISTYSTLDGLF